jgi:hypothetical protein
LSLRRLLVLIPLVGCASQPGDTTLEITFSPCEPVLLVPAADATAAEIASIDHAIELWRAVGIDGPMRSDGKAPGGVPVRFEDAAGAFHGVYEDEVGVIYINRTITDDHARAVTIAHEVGHAMGLLHVPAGERSSVMNPGNMLIEPDALDRGALEAIWGACPAESGGKRALPTPAAP